jgi:hypothetical protein
MQYSNYIFGTLFWAFLCSFSFTELAAQSKRGDPNLKPYKEDLKKAKEGDLRAALLIANVCKAHQFESGLVKDYQKAVEWYNKALANQADTMGNAAKGLLEIYLTGGYGVNKDFGQARNIHQLLVKKAAKSSLIKVYHDKKHLNLADFFVTYDSARLTGNKQAKLKLARFYWEFGLNPITALDTLAHLADMPDALYLDEKWRLESKAYYNTGKQEISEETYYNLIEKHVLMGSNLARSEWAYLATKATQGSRFVLKADEMQRLLSTYSDNDVEMQFKMYLILQGYQKGVPKYITLRNLAGMYPKVDSITQTFGKETVEKFATFDKDIATVQDFVEEMQENPEIKLFEVDVNAYLQNFDGATKPLVKLYKDMQKPEVLALVGEKNFGNYMAELNKQVRPVFDRIDTSKEMIEFKKLYDNEVWLSYFKNEFDTLVNCRLKDFEINDSNISFYYEMLVADEVKFRTLSEGKNYLYNLQSRIAAPFYRAKIASYIKEKVIQDVIGESPTKEQIESLQKTIENETWLQPEGRNKWFHYTSDSKNWFSGKVQRNNVTYAYTVVKQTMSDKYDLNIQAIVGDKSSMAFSSYIRIFEHHKGEYTIQVYFAQYIKYHWQAKETDFLRVVYKKHEHLVTAQPVGGNMAASTDKNHGYAPEQVLAKVIPADFSEKTAIRTAVQCLILEYVRAFQNK